MCQKPDADCGRLCVWENNNTPCPGGGTCQNGACVICTPTTCAAQGKNCGSIPSGCGAMLDCGVCTPPQTCGGGTIANVCGCTSNCAGKTCGDNGCGGSCGSCTAPQVCGGGGTPGVCSCTPTSCTPPQTCGGGGIPGVCGCTPTTCVAQGKNCDWISDRCGGTLYCGACTPPQTCGGGTIANVCGCTPNCASKTCGPDGCGGSCGPCNGPQQSCIAGICQCFPISCPYGYCGLLADGCGGALTCLAGCPCDPICP